MPITRGKLRKMMSTGESVADVNAPPTVRASKRRRSKGDSLIEGPAKKFDAATEESKRFPTFLHFVKPTYGPSSPDLDTSLDIAPRLSWRFFTDDEKEVFEQQSMDWEPSLFFKDNYEEFVKEVTDNTTFDDDELKDVEMTVVVERRKSARLSSSTPVKRNRRE